jgi:GT2 family glycosyltransferase
LDYPADLLEVIVVDDGSPMSLDVALPSYTGEAPIRMLRQENAGPASARNAGVKVARGEYIAITDDDCQPAPDWLKRLVQELERFPGYAIGGHTVNSLPNNPCAIASQLLIDYLYDYYETRDGRFFASNNMIVSADQFKQIGGFDCSFPGAAAEDRDFFRRWLDAGFKMTFCPEAIMYHGHEMNFAGFLRQHFLYGRGAYHYHKLKADGACCGIKLEPPHFYRNLFGYPWTRDFGCNPVLLDTLLLFSQGANAAGFFCEKFSAGNH